MNLPEVCYKSLRKCNIIKSPMWPDKFLTKLSIKSKVSMQNPRIKFCYVYIQCTFFILSKYKFTQSDYFTCKYKCIILHKYINLCYKMNTLLVISGSPSLTQKNCQWCMWHLTPYFDLDFRGESMVVYSNCSVQRTYEQSNQFGQTKHSSGKNNSRNANCSNLPLVV